MTRRTLTALGLLLSLTAGCNGDSFEARIAGSVDGLNMTITTAYWGGPFIVFTDDSLDCKGLAFISKNTKDGDEPLLEYDARILLLTYNDSDVVEGSYDFGGEAPVTAELIDISGGSMSVYRASEGTMVLDALEDEGLASGEFAISFEENNEDLGALTGDFTLPWCINLKSSY